MDDREKSAETVEEKLVPDRDLEVQRSPDNRSSRHLWYRSICAGVGYMSAGFSNATYGPSLLQLALYFGTDLHSVAWGMTTWSTGYLVGNIMCATLFDRFNKEISLCVSLYLFGLTLGVSTLAGGLYPYLALIAVFGIFHGFSSPAAQAYCFGLWEGHSARKYVIQATFFMWSVGATASPFITRAFLVPLPESAGGQSVHSCNASSDVSYTSNGHLTDSAAKDLGVDSFVSTQEDSNSTYEMFLFNESLTSIPTYPVHGVNATVAMDAEYYASVRFCYVTAGGFAILAATLFSFDICKNGLRSKLIINTTRKLSKESDGKNTIWGKKHQSAKSVAIIHVLLVAFSFFYQLAETATIYMISAFAVKELCWENKTAALLASVVFFSHGVGRLSGILIVRCVSPKTMLLGDVTLQLISYVIMLFVSRLDSLMWVSGSLAGFSMSTVFATSLLYVSDVIEVTGRTTSALMISTSLAGMVGPVFVGFLFEAFSPICFVYFCLAASVLQVVFFFVLDIYKRVMKG